MIPGVIIEVILRNQNNSHDGGSDVYRYDEHCLSRTCFGSNTTAMPHLPEIFWDYRDQLKDATLNASRDMAYYTYDASGERVRKVVEKGHGIVEQRIYMGGWEVYRKTISGTLDFERETLRIMDDRKAIAHIETKTIENGRELTPTTNLRYQYDNLPIAIGIGSACLELDQNAAIISYEEYHPFGTSSYRSGTLCDNG